MIVLLDQKEEKAEARGAFQEALEAAQAIPNKQTRDNAVKRIRQNIRGLTPDE